MRLLEEQLFINRRRLVKNGMTYALGAVCKDGVVIISDKLITEKSGEPKYDDKTYRILNQAIMVAAGPSRADFELFLLKFGQKVKDLKQVPEGWVNYQELKLKISETIYQNSRENRVFDTLLAIRPMPLEMPELFYFDETGGIRKINDYYAIGAAEPLGRFFLRIFNKIFNKNYTMKQAAILGTFIILHIEKLKLDYTVGIGDNSPTIWWIPCRQDEFPENSSIRKEENQNTLNIIRDSAEELFKSYYSCTEQFFSSLKL